MRFFHAFIFSFCWVSVFGQLRINEVQTSNATTLEYKGETPDWIEIKNTSGQAINLEGYTLSDESSEPDKFIFQNTPLPQGAFFVVYASNTTDTTSSNETTFSLAGGKDTVFLFDDNETMIDWFYLPCIPMDKSGGWSEIYNSNVVFDLPSPGIENSNDTIEITNYTDVISPSVTPGFHEKPVEVKLIANDPRTTIYYSLNGDEAEEDELIYEQAILLSNKKYTKDKISDEPTSPLWIEPKGPVFKGNILRARGYYKSCPVSPPFHGTYFIDESISDRYNVPIISLISDRDNFFDYEDGIYVPGSNFNENDAGYSGNYFETGKAWERQADMEMFAPNGKLLLKQHVGVRINGNTSRSYPQKSMRIYGRNDFNNKETLDFPFFSDRPFNAYETVVLRTPGADLSHTYFKDLLCHEIAKELIVDYQDYQQSVVFLNGEYWGIHNIRERQDEFYLKRLYGVQKGNYDLISMNNFSINRFEVVEGDLNEYDAMLNYVRTHDLTQDEHMDTMYKLIDIPNFIDYHVLQLFVANTDWGNANTKYWKTYDEDGKWRWLFFDCDRCFTDIDNPRLNVITGNTLTSDWPAWASELPREMLKNEKFKNQFISRFNYALQEVFSTSRVLKIIDELEALYAPLVFEQVERWRQPETAYEWRDNVNGLREFAMHRPLYMADLLEKNFGLPYSIYPNPASELLRIKDVGQAIYNVDIDIVNSQGKTILSRQAYTLNSTVDISNLEKGFYIVIVNTGERSFRLPFIKN